MPFDPAPIQTEKQKKVAAARKALSDIAAFLPRIPDRQWEFEAWRVQGRDRLSLPISKAFCGTVGCAIGHGITSLPSVQALLTFSANGKPSGHACEPPWMPLNMTRDDFDGLFTMTGYNYVPTQHQVAKRIEQYLARTA